MMLALFLWASGEGLFTYIQPIYVQQLGANPVQIGTVLALAGLAMTVAFLPGGILSDRIPRKIILLGGWALGIVGVLRWPRRATGAVLSPASCSTRFLPFAWPAISATVADSAGGAPLSRVITLVYAGYSTGSIISPAAGGWLAQMTDMRTVYLVAAVCYAISTLVILMIKPQPVQARAWQRPSFHVVRSNGLLALIAFAMFLPLYIGVPLAPNFMRNVAGWPVNRIGLLGSLYALGLTVLSPTLGRLSARHPIRGLLAGQALVWVSLGLLFIGAQGRPAIAFAAFFLRGGYGACRSLAGAQIAGHACWRKTVGRRSALPKHRSPRRRWLRPTWLGGFMMFFRPRRFSPGWH